MMASSSLMENVTNAVWTIAKFAMQIQANAKPVMMLIS